MTTTTLDKPITSMLPKKVWMEYGYRVYTVEVSPEDPNYEHFAKRKTFFEEICKREGVELESDIDLPECSHMKFATIYKPALIKEVLASEFRPESEHSWLWNALVWNSGYYEHVIKKCIEQGITSEQLLEYYTLKERWGKCVFIRKPL